MFWPSVRDGKKFDAMYIPFLSSNTLWSVAMNNKVVHGPEVQGKVQEAQPVDLR